MEIIRSQVGSSAAEDNAEKANAPVKPSHPSSTRPAASDAADSDRRSGSAPRERKLGHLSPGSAGRGGSTHSSPERQRKDESPLQARREKGWNTFTKAAKDQAKKVAISRGPYFLRPLPFELPSF